MSIVILGAGPAGLGAAWRLQELGFEDWVLLEAESYAGGLATSFRDRHGFTWDVGGHVQFSHYEYFDRVMDALLRPDEWLHHRRKSYVWIRGRFVPYPLQNNLHLLPEEDLARCLDGLRDRPSAQTPRNFRDWILASFGAGIAELFLFPYNFKVWAHPLEMMSATWVGERVATISAASVDANARLKRGGSDWGPNATFRFPKRGGTGAIWARCAARLPSSKLHFNRRVSGVDPIRREVRTESGEVYRFDQLISTLPLPALHRFMRRGEVAERHAAGLLSTATHVVGVGLEGQPSESLRERSWMYFPEADCPFYRVTMFSGYSPENVPDPARHWSLMCETAESAYRPVNAGQIADETIEGLRATRLISERDKVVSLWHYRAPLGYPVPGLHRDEVLEELLPELEKLGIYSRGRFGAWKYEVSNQDHSFQQGVEIVSRLLLNEAESTLPFPEKVNRPR